MEPNLDDPFGADGHDLPNVDYDYASGRGPATSDGGVVLSDDGTSSVKVIGEADGCQRTPGVRYPEGRGDGDDLPPGYYLARAFGDGDFGGTSRYAGRVTLRDDDDL